MRTRLAVAVLAAVAAADPVQAIPAFARRYGVACHVCHDGYPKLNALGQRFKERGLRMEREDDFDASRWLRSVPASVRASASRFFIEEGKGQSSGLLKGISAGDLGKRFSYWIDDGVFVSEGSDHFTHAKPDNLWIRLEVITGGGLYARAGRLELDLPFTQVRSPHLFPYEIYFANTGYESDALAGYKEGFEVGGDLAQDVHWSAALVKRQNTSEGLSTFGNLYLRVRKRAERSRFGAFAYIGRNRLSAVPPQSWEDDFFRIGVDADVWIQRLDLYGTYVYGRNNNSTGDLAPAGGTDKALRFNGGFAQADYHLREDVVLTLRLNLVNRPPGATDQPRQSFASLFPGIQLFFFERLKLSFEYGFLNKDRLDYGALQAEISF